MNIQKNINKVLAVTIVAVSVPFFLGASTISGTSGETKKTNKYSLSNLNLYSRKAINFNLFKSPNLYSGSTILNQTNTPSGIQINTSMQFQRGNTTYIFPYKLKLKVSRFKLPAPTPTH